MKYFKLFQIIREAVIHSIFNILLKMQKNLHTASERFSFNNDPHNMPLKSLEICKIILTLHNQVLEANCITSVVCINEREFSAGV